MDNPVSHGRNGLIVSDENDRHMIDPAGFLQQTEDVTAGVVVQSAGGLVAKQQFGALGQRTGNGHPLLLSAGELGGNVACSLSARAFFIT